MYHHFSIRHKRMVEAVFSCFLTVVILAEFEQFSKLAATKLVVMFDNNPTDTAHLVI
jgi:hypothetical protein